MWGGGGGKLFNCLIANVGLHFIQTPPLLTLSAKGEVGGA